MNRHTQKMLERCRSEWSEDDQRKFLDGTYFREGRSDEELYLFWNTEVVKNQNKWYIVPTAIRCSGPLGMAVHAMAVLDGGFEDELGLAKKFLDEYQIGYTTKKEAEKIDFFTVTQYLHHWKDRKPVKRESEVAR